jgi:hypothetical protein
MRGRRSDDGWSWAGQRPEGTCTDRFIAAGKNSAPTLDSSVTFPGGCCSETWPAQRGSEATRAATPVA